MPIFSNSEAYKVGQYQRIMLWLLLISLFAHFIPPALILSGILVSLATYKFAKAEKCRRPLLWALWSVLPLLGYVSIFLLYSKANQILRDQGLEVGILGAKKSDLESLLKAGSEMHA